MDFDRIYLIVSTISLIVLGYLAVRDYLIKKQKAPTDRDLNVSAAVKNLADALNLSSNELVESLADAAELRAEVNKLRLEVQALKIQIADGEKRYENAKRVIQRLVAALKEANIDIPQEIGDLSDSVHNWKWPEK